MVRLLIADDEPLVCVGLQSMLDWDALGVEIVGTARNGGQALEMIEALRPDIVLSDIKMPVKSGLEVAEESLRRFGRPPLFILLTSYEAFDYVRTALKLGTVDYLMKLELDAQTLTDAVGRAIERLQTLPGRAGPNPAPQQAEGRQALREKLFIRILHNLFDSQEDCARQTEALGIDLDGRAFAAVSFAVEPPDGSGIGDADVFGRFASALRIASETLTRYFPCHLVTLDLWHFAAVLRCDTPPGAPLSARAEEAVRHAVSLLGSYLNLDARAGIGHFVPSPWLLAGSFQASQHCCRQATQEAPVLRREAQGTPGPDDAGTQAVLLEIRAALEEMDSGALEASLAVLAQRLRARPGDFLGAMDAAAGVRYTAISLLPGGEMAMREIFGAPEEHRALYRLRTVEAVARWLDRFAAGADAFIASRRKNHKRQVIESVKQYIDGNLASRLSLQEVAGLFNFSPNYLSQLFARYTGVGFVDYITARRVREAKRMLREDDAKVYEIAQRLGFESSYYFSKVFKKAAGLSPREYQQRHRGGESRADDPPGESE